MLDELVGREDKLFERRDFMRPFCLSIKHVDRQLAVDLDRIRFSVLVEVHATTEATDRGVAWLVKHRVRPDRQDFGWHVDGDVFVKPAILNSQLIACQA